MAMKAATTDFVRRECLEAAQALERFFTPRARKRTAAILLRNASIVKPHCKFCANRPQPGIVLHESPYDPTTWICEYCAWYIARGREMMKLKSEAWARLKDFAP
jgi:hypothetical protein